MAAVTASRDAEQQSSYLKCYFGVERAQASRAYMQDRHVIVEELFPGDDAGHKRQFIGVFDGHTNETCAQHAAERLPGLLARQTVIQQCTGSENEEEAVVQAIVSIFKELDREALGEAATEGHRQYGGSTAVCALIVGEVAYVIQLGDSRAVLCRDGKAIRLTRDHKPVTDTQERQRIEAAGGEVIEAHNRVQSTPEASAAEGANFRLSMSRSLGDVVFKTPRELVTPVPDVSRVPLLHGRDSFLLLASDGVFDVLSDQLAADIAQMIINDLCMLPAEAAQGSAIELISQALQEGATDNCTALISVLAWDQGPST